MSSWYFLPCARSNQRGWLSALHCWFLLQRGRSHGPDWSLQPGSVHALYQDPLVLYNYLLVASFKKQVVCSAPASKHCVVFPVTLTGYWCPPGQTGATALPCPPGHFCLQGSAAPEVCPSGTYQDREKQATCNVCEAGVEHISLYF